VTRAEAMRHIAALVGTGVLFGIFLGMLLARLLP